MTLIKSLMFLSFLLTQSLSASDLSPAEKDQAMILTYLIKANEYQKSCQNQKALDFINSSLNEAKAIDTLYKNRFGVNLLTQLQTSTEEEIMALRESGLARTALGAFLTFEGAVGGGLAAALGVPVLGVPAAFIMVPAGAYLIGSGISHGVQNLVARKVNKKFTQLAKELPEISSSLLSAIKSENYGELSKLMRKERRRVSALNAQASRYTDKVLSQSNFLGFRNKKFLKVAEGYARFQEVKDTQSLINALKLAYLTAESCAEKTVDTAAIVDSSIQQKEENKQISQDLKAEIQ